MPRHALEMCRVMIAALALFVATGLAHFVQDVYKLAVSDDTHHVDDCGADGDDCPPACPDCHCSRGGYTAPDAFDACAMGIAWEERMLPMWDPVRFPPSPDRDSLFRPPRV